MAGPVPGSAYRFIRWLLGRATRVFFRRIEVAGLGGGPRRASWHNPQRGRIRLGRLP
jgi:hypothetical protein